MGETGNLTILDAIVHVSNIADAQFFVHFFITDRTVGSHDFVTVPPIGSVTGSLAEFRRSATTQTSTHS